MEKQIQNYLKILDASPDNAPAFEALCKIYEENERWGELAALYVQRAERSSQDANRPPLLFKAADIYAERLANFDRMEECLQDVLDIDPLNDKALEMLKARFRDGHRWDRLILLLEQEARAQQDPAQAADLYTEIAGLLSRELESDDESVEYLEKAQATAPDHLPSLKQLKNHYIRSFQVDRAIALVEREAALLDSDEARGELNLEVGLLLAEDPFERQRAESYLQQAVSMLSRGQAKPAKEKLKELQALDKKWEDYTRAYAEEAMSVSDKRDASAIYLKVAGITYLYAPEREDDIMASIEKSLLLDANNSRALLLGERFLTEREDWNKLVDFYRGIFTRTRDERLKVDAMARTARVLDEKMGDSGAALDLYREVIQLAPENADAFRAVSTHMRENEDWDALDALLADRLARSHEPAVKIDTLLELARVAVENKDDPKGALKYLEQITDMEPGEPRAARMMLELYERSEQWSKLADALHAVCAQSDDPAERGALEWRLGEVLRRKLKRLEDSYDHYGQAFLVDPENPERLAVLDELTIELENWEKLVELITRVIEADEPPANRRALAFKLGQIYDRELSQYEDAERCYRGLIEEEEDLDTLDALGRLYSKDQRWTDLVDTLERKTALVARDDVKRDVLLEMARVYEEELNDAERAVDAYKRVVAVAPDELEALKNLERLLEAAGDFAGMAEILDLQLDAVVSIPEKVNLNEKLGRIYGETLGDAEASARAYLKVLDLDATHLPAIEALEALLGQGVLADDVFKGLEAYYQRLEKWDKLAEGYEALMKSEENEQARGELCRKLAEIHLNNRDMPEKAFEWVREGLSLGYYEPEFLNLALNVARKIGSQDELLTLLEQRTESIDDPATATRLHASLGHLYWEGMQDAEAAQLHYQEAADLSPDNAEVLIGAADFFKQIENWEQRARLLQMLADARESADEKLSALFEAADVLLDHLEDYDGASAMYQRILEIEPGNAKALERLITLQELTEDWEHAALTLQTKLEHVSQGPDALAARLKLAAILDEHIQRHDEAAEQYAHVLRDDPLNQAAFEGMERFLDKNVATDIVAATLLPVYEERGDAARLAQVLTAQFEAAEDEDAYLLAVRIASLSDEELGDPARAFEWYGRAFAVAPGTALISELMSTAEATGEWAALVGLIDAKLETDLEEAERAALLKTAGEIEGDRLSDPQAAEARFTKLSELNPEDEGALESLIRIAREREDAAALAGLLERKREIAAEKNVQREAALELADLRFEKLDQTEEALALLEELMEERENDAPTFERLERIYEATERFDELLEMLKRRLKYLREDDDILPVKIRIGAILENRLDRPDEAMKIYRSLVSDYWSYPVVAALVDRLLAQDATQLAIANEMEKKYLKTQDWQRLVLVYEIQLKHAEKQKKKTKLLSKLSDIYQDKLQDPEKAFQGYARVFVDDPSNQTALDELEKLAGELGSWKELAEVYERAGEKSEDTLEAVELFVKAARLYEDILAFQEDAIRVYRKVLNRDPVNMTAIQALEGLCTKTERWEELRDIYLQRVDLTDDPMEKKELYANVCQLYEEALEDPAGAAPYYEEMLAITPDDENVITGLHILYESGGHWDKLAGLLEHKLSLVERFDEKNALMLERAAILDEHLDDAQGARDLYQTVLESDETNETALKRLEAYVEDNEELQDSVARFLAPYYLKWDRWERLIDMKEVQYTHSEDAAERLALLKDMAETYEVKLDQNQLAYAVLTRAFREAAGDDEVRLRLEELAGEIGQFEQLAGLYEEKIAQLDLETEGALAVTLLIDAAGILENHLREVEEAAERYRRVLQIDVTDHIALANLERIYSLQKKWVELIEILERKLSVTEQLDAQKALLFQISNIFEEELDDNPSAIATYRRILEMDESDGEVLHALVRLTTAEGLYEDLIEVRKRQLALTEMDVRRHELRFEIALVLWRNLERADEAIALFADVLEDDPAFPPVRDALETMLDEEATELAAARILEPRYQDESRFDDLLRVLNVQAKHAESADAARDFFLRMADVAETALSAPELAFAFTVSAFERDAFNADIRERLERLAAQTQRFEDLAAAYRARVDHAPDSDQQVDLLLNAGRITLREMNDPEAAEGVYNAVRIRQDDNPAALEALDEIYERTEQWAELVDVLFARAVIAENDDERIALFTRAAVVRETRLDDKSGAVQAYLDALGVDATHMPTLIELDRLYGELERYSELSDTLSSRMMLTEALDERLALTMRKGQVEEDKLDNRAGALDIYAGILAEQDEYADAIEAIENMVADTEVQDAALAVLTPLFESKGWWERLADLLEVQVDTLAGPARRIDVLQRIEVIYEQNLMDAERAFQVACRIFEQDVHNQHSRQEMERLAVVTGGFEGLVNTYRSFFEQIDDHDLKVEILTKIARIYEEQLERDADAIEAYRGVVELESGNFTAMLALDRLYERNQRYTDLVALIPSLFEFYDDPQEITDLRLRLGSLWEEKLNDNQTAIDVYVQVLDEHPDHQQALGALERLYEKEAMWTELIEIYKAQVRIARGDTKKARLYDRMAAVYFEQLDQAQEAIPLWNRVLQFDEHNDEVRLKLENLYAHEEMWDKLVEHYKKRLRMVHAGAERAELTKKMAQVMHERLEMEDQATQLFLKVLEYTPDDLEVIDRLEEIYLKNQSWRDLVELLTRLLGKVEGDELRSLYLRLTSINVEHLANIAEAETLAQKVLDLSPAPQELERLERLFARTDSHDLILRILESRAAQVEEENEAIALNFRMAEILQRHLKDDARARERLEAVLALKPGNLAAAEALEPIYESAELWAQLIEVLNIRLAEADGERERRELLERIAALYEDKLDDRRSAFGMWADLWQLDPSDAKLLQRLEGLAEATDMYLELAHLLRDMLPEVRHDAKLTRLLTLKVAKIYEEKAVNRDLAAEYYKMFIEGGEYNEYAVNYLIAYYESMEEWEELVRMYQTKIPYMNQEEKVDVGCRVAEIFNRYMDNRERAIKTYRQVLKMDDGNERAIEALIAIFESEEMWEDLADMLRRKLHVVSDPERIAALRMRIAELYQDKLDDLKQAKTFYRAIIVDDPKHQAALDALETIYELEENYDELLEVLSRRVNVAESDQARIAIYRKMAEIWETKFEQRDMAVNYLEKILGIEGNNMEAIGTLERIYRESGDWPRLASAYQRHIDQTIDAEEIVRLYTEMGRIYGEYLFKPSEAIEYFNKALKIEENNLDVLGALAELYSANEKWESAIEVLDRMAGLAETKEARVDALARLGHIYLENLGDRERAKGVFDRMVAEDPTFVPALSALREYYAATEDWPNFLKMVNEEKTHATDPRKKAEALYEEGRYYHRQEDDVDRAMALYAEALEAADDYVPALEVMGEITFERQQWDTTKPVLQRLLEVCGDTYETLTRARLHYRLAYIAEQEENGSESLKQYTAAYKLDSNSLPTLEGLARTLYARGDWERAFRVYQTILVRFRDKKSVPELVELFSRLGEVNGRMEKNDVAVRMYEKALELDPDSVRALKAIVFFYESLENWKKALQYRSRLIKRSEGDELFEQWRAVGDIYAEKLDKPEKGLEAYRHALEIRANDVWLLGKVARLLMAAGQIEDAIGVLRSAVVIEKDPERLFDLNVQLGDMLRDRGDDPNASLEYYNAALDVQPERMDIFHMMEGFLSNREDWEALDGAYRLMIARVPEDDTSRKLTLWRKLADLLADHGELEDAIRAWEVVASLNPDDLTAQERIADLYARSPEHREQAVGMHRALLQRDPRRANSYRALWKIHYEAEEFDKAFCFGAAVDYLGGGESPAVDFYRENRPDVKHEAINTLDPQLWGTLLMHEGARYAFNQVLNIVFHHVPGIMPSDLRKEGLKKRDRLDLGEHINVCTTTTYILKTLGVPTPEIYMRRDWGPDAQPLSVQPAAVMIGADAFENFPQRKLVFLMGRAAILARPEFLVGLQLPLAEVRKILDAAAMIVDPRFKGAGDATELKALKKRIEKAVPKKVREPFGGYAADWIRASAEIDLDKWRKALVLTANRGAMLIANDLPESVETLHAYPGGLSAQDISDVENDLLTFSTSDAYFHLRNYLGFSIV